jgi:GTPase SAR1 family protein
MNSNTNENFSGDNHDYVFKFVIIGDSGVGKSCIMHHFIFNKCTIFKI